MESLPPPNTIRWVVHRKAAVRSGGTTIEKACRVYQLSKEELLSWERAFEIHGRAGLRVTRVRQHRSPRRVRLAPQHRPMAEPLRWEVGRDRDVDFVNAPFCHSIPT